MNKSIFPFALRILMYVAVQVFVLKEIELGDSGRSYIEIIVYPAGMLFLPFHVSQFFLLILAFAVGVVIDLFYHSPGVHAGACLWMMLCRPLVLKWLEPKNGYGVDQTPSMSVLGAMWLFKYMGILLTIFFLSYFSLKIFTFVYLPKILLKAFLSFSVSIVIVFLIHILFSKKS